MGRWKDEWHLPSSPCALGGRRQACSGRCSTLHFPIDLTLPITHELCSLPSRPHVSIVCTFSPQSKHGKLQQDDSTPTGSRLLSVTALPSSIMPAPVSGAPASQRDRRATPADANTIHQDSCLPAIAAHGRLTIHVRPGLALLQIPLRDDNVCVPRTWENGELELGERARPDSTPSTLVVIYYSALMGSKILGL
jgi:hypothetical protein